MNLSAKDAKTDPQRIYSPPRWLLLIRGAVGLATVVTLIGLLVLGVLLYRETVRAVDAVDKAADAVAETATTADAEIEGIRDEVGRAIGKLEAFCAAAGHVDSSGDCHLYLRVARAGVPLLEGTATETDAPLAQSVQDGADPAPQGTQRRCTHDGRGHAHLGYNPGTHTHPTGHAHSSGKCAGI